MLKRSIGVGESFAYKDKETGKTVVVTVLKIEGPKVHFGFVTQQNAEADLDDGGTAAQNLRRSA